MRTPEVPTFGFYLSWSPTLPLVSIFPVSPVSYSLLPLVSVSYSLTFGPYLSWAWAGRLYTLRSLLVYANKVLFSLFPLPTYLWPLSDSSSTFGLYLSWSPTFLTLVFISPGLGQVSYILSGLSFPTFTFGFYLSYRLLLS